MLFWSLYCNSEKYSLSFKKCTYDEKAGKRKVEIYKIRSPRSKAERQAFVGNRLKDSWAFLKLRADELSIDVSHDMNGKEAQMGGIIHVCVTDSFYCTVETNIML